MSKHQRVKDQVRINGYLAQQLENLAVSSLLGHDTKDQSVLAISIDLSIEPPPFLSGYYRGQGYLRSFGFDFAYIGEKA